MCHLSNNTERSEGLKLQLQCIGLRIAFDENYSVWDP